MGDGEKIVKRAADAVQKAEPESVLADPAVVKEGLKVAGKVLDLLKSYGNYEIAKVEQQTKIEEWERRLQVARAELAGTADTNALAREKLQILRESLAPFQKWLRDLIAQATNMKLPPTEAKELRAEILKLGQVLVDLHGKA